MPANNNNSRSKSKQNRSGSTAPTSQLLSAKPVAGPTTVPPISSSLSLSSSAPPQQLLPSSGFLVTCDPPTKQYIKFLDKSRNADKKFIIEDLDASHLLIDGKARDEILRKVEAWMDENVFTNVERVGENLET